MYACVCMRLYIRVYMGDVGACVCFNDPFCALTAPPTAE